MTQKPIYTIGQLAEAAEVTPRTIRYYTAEGLLPPPQTQGRYSCYHQAHLLRLRLIQRLKNAFLPLAAIKAQMDGLSDAEVETLLSRCPPSSEGTQEPPKVHVRTAEPHDRQGRLDYVAQILAVTGQAMAEPASGDAPHKPRRVLLVSPSLRPQNGEKQPGDGVHNGSLSAPSGGPREIWERIPLAAGVELHVRTPETTEARERMERRIAAAKALFAGDAEAKERPQ